MADSPFNQAIRRTLLRLHGAEALADAQLLERYVTHQEQASFDMLVRRHGPMVLRTCQRVVHDAQLAEDAFQATFIVLMRKAATLARPRFANGSVAGWLHQVAFRIAKRARRGAIRRSTREEPLEEGSAEAASSPSDRLGCDVRPILDEELNRLPEKYRVPMVLCYLEGKTMDETARQLNWPRGTVATRVSHALPLLRKRLARRGLALSAAGLATLFAEEAATAGVPPATLQTLAAAAMGSGATVREGAAILAKETLQAMFWSKIRWGGIFLACLLMLGTAAVKWTGATGKPATKANVSASEGDDFYVRWRFDNGPPKDIRVIAADPWEWARPTGKPGMMLAPRTTIVLLPTKVPKRPFVISVKLPLVVRRGRPSIIGGHWVDERHLNTCAWREWEKTGVILGKGPWQYNFYFAGRWVFFGAKGAKGEKFRFATAFRYQQAYPTQTVSLLAENCAIEEIELRGLRPEELPPPFQNPEATVKGWGFRDQPPISLREEGAFSP